MRSSEKWQGRKTDFREQARLTATSCASEPFANRGEPRCPFVIEIIGLPLALSVFPQVYDFSGDAVLQLVEPGLYKKGWRTNRGAG